MRHAMYQVMLPTVVNKLYESASIQVRLNLKKYNEIIIYYNVLSEDMLYR